MRLLSQIAAQALDNELMATPGFSLDQLMELAGLSVACAVAAVFPHARSILTLVGPGDFRYVPRPARLTRLSRRGQATTGATRWWPRAT